MKIIDSGHIYELAELDRQLEVSAPRLVFVKRIGERYPGNFNSHPGTTMQEVLRALLDRARYVNGQIPCVETELAIGHLQSALVMFEMRAARVHNRYITTPSLHKFETAQTCDICGHVGCKGH